LSIILILGGLGGLAKMSSNLVIPLLTVKIRQPSHEFTFGVGMTFVSYPLVLTPVV
jgi:predicted membrane-bound dolichyl-phosphate-mannose-protein mannosyltransferase